MRVLMGFVLLVLSPFSVAALAASEPEDCAADFVDTTGEVDHELVQAAVDEVGDLRVVTRSFAGSPGGDLDQWTDDFLATCHPGTENLVYLAFSLDDRAIVVDLGPSLPGGDAPDRVRDSMIPLLQDGDYTGALMTGVFAAEELVTEGDVPAPSTVADGGSGNPDEGGWPWRPTGLLLGGGALGGGGTWAYRRRRLNEARQRLEDAIHEPLSHSTAAQQRAQHVESAAETWAVMLQGRSSEVLRELVHRARQSTLELQRSVGLLRAATSEGIAKASRAEVRNAEQQLANLIKVSDRQEDAVDELVAFGAHVDHLRTKVAVKRDVLLEDLVDARALAGERSQAQWDVANYVSSLNSVEQTLQSLVLDDLVLDVLSLSETVEQAEADLVSVEHILQSLPNRSGALVEWCDAIDEAVTLELRRTEEAEQELARVAGIHSLESWRWAEHLPAETVEHLQSAKGASDEVRPQIDGARSTPALDALAEDLETAGLLLARADDHMDQVEDLVVDLDAAQRNAPSLVAESRVVLNQFQQFVAAHQGDLSARLSSKPEQLDDVVRGVETDLRRPLPNFLRIAQTAASLNTELDGLLAEAAEQKAAMDALRRQAARSIDQASTALARAERALGWQIMPSGEKRQLAQLRSRFAGLPLPDLNHTIDEARSIADEAGILHERIVVRRRRRNGWVVVGGGSSMGRSSGSSWGGGSSSGGSSGGGGGISFGGGGGGISFGGGGRSSGSW